MSHGSWGRKWFGPLFSAVCNKVSKRPPGEACEGFLEAFLLVRSDKAEELRSTFTPNYTFEG